MACRALALLMSCVLAVAHGSAQAVPVRYRVDMTARAAPPDRGNTVDREALAYLTDLVDSFDLDPEELDRYFGIGDRQGVFIKSLEPGKQFQAVITVTTRDSAGGRRITIIVDSVASNHLRVVHEGRLDVPPELIDIAVPRPGYRLELFQGDTATLILEQHPGVNSIGMELVNVLPLLRPAGTDRPVGSRWQDSLPAVLGATSTYVGGDVMQMAYAPFLASWHRVATDSMTATLIGQIQRRWSGGTGGVPDQATDYVERRSWTLDPTGMVTVTREVRYRSAMEVNLGTVTNGTVTNGSIERTVITRLSGR